MIRLVAATATLVVGPVLMLGLVGFGASSDAAGTAGGGLAGVSPVAVAAYRTAAGQAAVRWGCVVPAGLLAGVGAVESAHGTAGGASVDPPSGRAVPNIYGPVLDGSGAGGNATPVWDTDTGRWDDHVVFDRAVGPMQLLPGTWQRFTAAVDGPRDPHRYQDATLAAAWRLCGDGRGRDLSTEQAARRAVLDYNPSSAYVRRVLELARRLGPVVAGPAGGVRPARLLAHPRFSASPAAAADLRAGVVDGRLVGLLWTIAADQETRLYVSPFKTGHSRCVGGVDVAGCSESHHWYGRAVDIQRVAGEPVGPSNRQARQLAGWLAASAEADRLSVGVGSPWPFETPAFFTDTNHRDHLHLSVCGPRLRAGRRWSDCR